MTVYDITENVKIPPAIVVPLPVFGDGASSTPATTIPPIKPHVHFADPEAGRENTDSASKDSKLQREMRKLDGWTQIPMKNARRALIMASPPPKQHEEVLTTMVNENDRVVEIHWIYSTSLASDPGEPKGYKQAMTDPERDKWIKAMKVEINDFYKRSVGEISKENAQWMQDARQSMGV